MRSSVARRRKRCGARLAPSDMTRSLQVYLIRIGNVYLVTDSDVKVGELTAHLTFDQSLALLARVAG